MATYSEEQIYKLMESLEVKNVTSDEVEKLIQLNDYVGLCGVLNGTHKIVPVDNAIGQESLKVYLRDLLYPDETIELGPDDGTRMLFDAKDSFEAGTEFGFVNWKKHSEKYKIRVRVTEIFEDGTFPQIFGSLFRASPDEFKGFREFVKEHRQDLRKFCVGQGQIEEFATRYHDKLRRDDCGTFFLLENEDEGEFVVVDLRLLPSAMLGVDMIRLGFSRVWNARFLHRLVLPQVE
ncbi:MAG: hypothetical protein WC682_00330 [Parcubacteria group bacterium]|jgi:hypothetical protein